MKLIECFGIGFLLAASISCGAGWPNSNGAKAEILDNRGNKLGSARLTQEKGGVRIALKVSGIPPGIHGLHIHENGACHGPDFKSAGEHFNPFGKKHGLKNPEGPHAGDLPNIKVGADRTAEVSVLAPLVTLGEGKNSLFRPGGTCLVIHSKPDDERTDPSGNSGDRIACGVIEKEDSSSR